MIDVSFGEPQISTLVIYFLTRFFFKKKKKEKKAIGTKVVKDGKESCTSSHRSRRYTSSI